MAMKERSIPIAQTITAVFAVAELGLTAYLISGDWNAPARLRLLHFASIWSLFVLAFLALAPRYLPGLFHRIPMAALALECITAIFWLGGSIALAAYWGIPSCSGNSYCGSSQAAIAFGFFLFALFCFLLVADGLGFVRGNGQRAANGHHASKPPTQLGV
ncbi:membrane-associating domain-containing protein [Chaetomium strumarium]|uniref:Membrane-associating domain-containing protein n=1 Tax=Chaetomium strumarium TaxID=1170767 RepID=A0AAJ0LZM7_9PEZI|nr:membrane-associating domain-containing protein [Chaetomium strumarium]